MEAVTQVMFNRKERKVLELAMLAAPVAYRDDVDELRRLNGVGGKGEAVSRRRLVHAEYAYRTLLALLDEEAQEDYWLQQVSAEGRAREEELLPAPLRWEAKAKVMAEARKLQAENVRAALALLRAALQYATDPGGEAVA